jgi:hypothetical protein
MVIKNMNKYINKKVLLPISIIILALGIFVFFYSPVIFQEGNLWPEIKGIVQLTFGGSDIVKLSGSDNKYLTRSKDGPGVIETYMRNKGYEYTDQMGSGYFYKSFDTIIVLTRHQYSRFYIIWTIPENNNNSGTDNNLWTTITNNDGITFQYPKELSAKYISVVKWPPTVKIDSGSFSCVETPQEKSSMLEIISQRLVDNRIYCVNVKNEGAAGSVYSSFVYTTPKRGKLVSISFVLRYSSCANYDEEQNQACVSEREAFDLDATVDRLVQTVSWNSAFSEDTLANQISKCLVSSYSGGREKCDELLEQITDFDSCVMAGFSILKSNPAQCQTIDGRTFTQETNSTWEQALLAINNCEVGKAFQTHGRIVTLTLKNGNKLIAKEPQIDDIITIIGAVEPKCGKVPIGTE